MNIFSFIETQCFYHSYQPAQHARYFPVLRNRNYLFRLRIQIRIHNIFSIVLKINNLFKIVAFIMLEAALLPKKQWFFDFFDFCHSILFRLWFQRTGTESGTDPECILVQVPIPALLQVPVPQHWYFLNSYTVIYNKLCKNCRLVSNLNVGPVHRFQDSGV